MRFSINALLIVVSAFAVLIAVLLSVIPSYDDSPVRMTRQQALAELEVVRKKQNAVVFVEFDFYSMKHLRDRFRAIARDVERGVGRSKVYFTVIDFSSLTHDAYAPFSKWEGWEATAARGDPPIRGTGEVFWIRSGEIVESISAIERDPISTSVEKTLDVFKLKH